eukprot:CAMPEP_0180353988 /NCGR_PEP_ID=MMETSP0989-20121125/7955_1 /TAXON_ID=697907 /ORGANISM="non described non described, Strain CCMP2293" /LENGTH=136 /DNA_ID=CAMNT_0022343733 /DNA_START=197 /DNA_END=604 /DNA_ORIENTATION=-
MPRALPRRAYPSNSLGGDLLSRFSAATRVARLGTHRARLGTHRARLETALLGALLQLARLHALPRGGPIPSRGGPASADIGAVLLPPTAGPAAGTSSAPAEGTSAASPAAGTSRPAGPSPARSSGVTGVPRSQETA